MARDFLLNFGSSTKLTASGTSTTTLPTVVDVSPNGVNSANGLYIRVVVQTQSGTGTGSVQYSCSLEASKEPTATISTGTWSQIAATPSDVLANVTTVASGVVTEGAVLMYLRIHAPAGTMSTKAYTVGSVTSNYAEDNYVKFRVKVTDVLTGATNVTSAFSASIVSAVDGSLG